jgi:predicted dinucleotide-binding enzyme
MRARDLGDACVVDVEVEQREDGAEPRSYSFADAQQASTFVTEAVEARVYLGCEIHA